MSVRLDACVSAVAREVGLDPDRVSQDRLNIVAFINDTRRELYELPIDFSALEFTGELVSVANVTAGTVAATNQKAEVTGSSTAFATAMSGRYISIDGNSWQRISYVSDSTHLTLESSWNNDSVTAKTYKIWKRDYAMPAKVAKIKRFIGLDMYDASEFYQRFGFADVFGEPCAYTQFGTQDVADAYIGATIFTTVTTTAGSPLVDMTGVALVTALAPGDRLLIGNATTSTAYYVDKVLTDLRVALTHNVTISTATTSATAHSLDRLNVRFYYALDSAKKIILFEAKKKLFDLFDNSDLLEEGWYNAVRKGAIAKAMGYVASPKETLKIKEYEVEIANLIRNQYKAANPSFRFKISLPSRYGNIRGNSNYDDGY